MSPRTLGAGEGRPRRLAVPLEGVGVPRAGPLPEGVSCVLEGWKPSWPPAGTQGRGLSHTILVLPWGNADGPGGCSLSDSNFLSIQVS